MYIAFDLLKQTIPVSSPFLLTQGWFLAGHMAAQKKKTLNFPAFLEKLDLAPHDMYDI